MSIRLRLALWYTAVLGVTLIVFSLLLYLIMARHLIDEADEGIASRAQHIVSTIRVDAAVPGALARVELPPIDAFEAPGVYVQVVQVNGGVVAHSDNLGGQELPGNEQAFAAAHLEGIVLIDEFSSVITARTGTEINVGFFLKAADMKTASDETGERGDQTLLFPTFGAVVASSMGMLRPAANFDQFVGGLMYRFIVVHEMDPTPELGQDPDPDAIEELADRALEIRLAAPAELGLTDDARSMLRRYRHLGIGRAPNHHLLGFWQRLDGFILKLAMSRCISEARFEITEDDVTSCHKLLVDHLFPPMAEVVAELSTGKEKAAILGAVDSLYLMGERGMSYHDFCNALPHTTVRATEASITWLKERGFIHPGKRGTRFWVWPHAKDVINQ